MPTEPVASRVDPAAFDWASDEGPAENVRRVVAAATSADGRSPLNEMTLLSLRHHGLTHATLFVVADGFALVHEPSDTREVADLNLVVSPDRRGQRLGRVLLDAVRSAAPETPMSAWSHGNHPAAAALAASHGFERVRDLWVMRRSLRSELPALQDIDGIDVRPFVPGTDEEAFLAVNAEAFAHHPEQGNMTRADLDERVAEPWFDPAGFFLAFAGDSLQGFHWTKVDDASLGEVYVVGVSPSAQGSGLGKLLTLTGLHHLAAKGLDEVMLYVESDNTPAIAVYERLGFTHADADTDVMYELRPGRPSA